MTRQITTVQELDKLPIGAVIADLYDERGDAPVVLCKASDGPWAALTAGTVAERLGHDNRWWTSEEIAVVANRIHVLHSPDGAHLPDRDEIAEVLALAYWPEVGMVSRSDLKAADAVLELLTGKEQK